MRFIRSCDLTIKRKLLLFLISVILFIGIAVFSTLIYIYTDISRQTLTMTSKTLTLYTQQLNDSLSQLSSYSASLMFDMDVQKKLKQLSGRPDSYEKLLLSSSLNDKLFFTVSSLPFVDHIDILTTNDTYLTSAPVRIRHTNVDFDDYSYVTEQNGGCVWDIIQSDEQSGRLRLSRLIRTINDNFHHEPLGILTFDVNISELIDLEAFRQDYYQSCFLITDPDGNILYRSEASEEFASLPSIQDKAYQNLNNRSYFVTTAPSKIKEWRYCMLIPKKEILGHTMIVTKSLIVFFAILILVCIMVCVRLSGRITRPLIQLSRSMDTVAKGNFEISSEELLQGTSNDELHRICLHFIQMVEQLNTLITENYKVKLLNRDAQLSALQAQIDPHFLYNALDSVNWLAKLAGQQQISTIVQSLAALMRQTMDTSKKSYYLKDELQLIKHYLAIQQIRYGNRLDVAASIDHQLLEVPVPRLILQPFLENSIRYALEASDQTCEIVLKVSKENNVCCIQISDNGPGIDPDSIPLILSGQIQAKGNGVGIKNVNDRLTLLYSEFIENPLRISGSSSGGVLITIRIPLMTHSAANTISMKEENLYEKSPACR